MITKPAAFRVYGEPAPKGSLVGRCLTHPKIGQKALKAAKVDRFDHPRIWLNFDSVPDDLRGVVAFKLRPYLETYTADFKSSADEEFERKKGALKN